MNPYVALIVFALYQYLPGNVFFSGASIAVAFLWYFTSSGMSLRKKAAIASWSAPDNGSIYCKVSVDYTKLGAYIQAQRDKSKEKVTVTHAVGKAVAIALSKAPGLNGRIVLGRYVRNKTVDVSFLVSVEDGKNLSQALVKDIDKKSVPQISQELQKKSDSVRSGKDEDFQRNMQLIQTFPTFLLRPIAQLVGFITADLGISVEAIGLKARPFGSCLITSVGVFGVEEAYAPFTPFTRVPVLVLIGKVAEKAVVKDGKVVITPILKLMVTADHRYLDGHEGATLAKVISTALENPEILDNPSLLEKKKAS